MNVKRTLSLELIALGALLATTGCANQPEFDWFGMSKSKNASARAQSSPTKPGAKTASATKPKDGLSDEQSKQVDERIERYVRSINSRYDPAFEGNDFQSKIRRQEDPTRQEHIRQTAELTRDDPAPRRTARTLDDRSETSSPNPIDIHDQQRTNPSAEQVPAGAATPAAFKQPDSIADAEMGREQPIEPSASNPEPSGTLASDDPVAELKSASAEPTPGESSIQTAEIAATPPVIESIDASSEPEPKSLAVVEKTEGVKANTSPATAAPVIDPFKQRIDAQEASVAKDPANLEEQFKLRMLYLLDGREDKAQESIKGADSETQEIVLAQIRSLITAKAASQRDPAIWANQQLEAIEKVRSLVRGKADLKVPSVIICNAIDGFGRYTPIEPAEFKAGQQNYVLVYIEVDNFATEKTATGQYRTLLSVRQSLLNKAGEELWNAKDENIEDLARGQRRDFYLSIGPMAIPKSLSPGEYVLKIEVEDMLAGKINGNSAAFILTP